MNLMPGTLNNCIGLEAHMLEPPFDIISCSWPCLGKRNQAFEQTRGEVIAH